MLFLTHPSSTHAHTPLTDTHAHAANPQGLCGGLALVTFFQTYLMSASMGPGAFLAVYAPIAQQVRSSRAHVVRASCHLARPPAAQLGALPALLARRAGASCSAPRQEPLRVVRSLAFHCG